MASSGLQTTLTPPLMLQHMSGRHMVQMHQSYHIREDGIRSISVGGRTLKSLSFHKLTEFVILHVKFTLTPFSLFHGAAEKIQMAYGQHRMLNGI